MRRITLSACPVAGHHDTLTRYAVVFAGQGETPDGMKTAWAGMLRKALPGALLERVSYAVFGLGDSGYVQYNVAAKKLDRRLQQLGGHRLLEKGLGDDQVRASLVSLPVG